MKRWKGMSIIFAVSFLLAAPAWSQDFPKGPINYMNPFNPGGEVDIAARAMQPYLDKTLGVPFVIQYLPGAGGALCWKPAAAVSASLTCWRLAE
jgi:tripartite-type tricarboxylate transporter receptor subunit TctC